MKELNEASAVDFLIVYQFIKRLATPFEKTDAFELGLIDADGKRLKKAESKDEKNAMTPFDRLIFNLKRILTKFGLGGRLSTTAAALLLLREYTEEQIENEEFLIAELKESINMLNKKSFKTLKQLQEELANVTGPAVAGTGDDPVHWSRKQPKIDYIYKKSGEKWRIIHLQSARIIVELDDKKIILKMLKGLNS